MTDVRYSVRDLFRELAGRDAEGVWSAPGRVNLIGEHTDYNDGFVLPFAIDRRTVVAAGRQSERVIRVASALGGSVVEAPLDELAALVAEGAFRHEWSGYVCGVAWALGEAIERGGAGVDLSSMPGVTLTLDSTVPVGAGLSSSAAVECAVAIALADLWDVEVDRATLARVGRLAENDAVGAPTGIMDQSASLLGRADGAVFLDCRSLDTHVVDLGFRAADVQVVVIDTTVKHSHATGGYGERRASCEAGAAALGVTSLRDVSIDDLDRARSALDDVTFRRVRHVVTENQRVLDTVSTLRHDGPRAIGALLDASHTSMRDDFEISVAELDLAVETARSVGAIGARMTGGGFGGAAIALVEAGDVSRLQVAVDGAFAEHGFAAPIVFPVTPSDGATRES